MRTGKSGKEFTDRSKVSPDGLEDRRDSKMKGVLSGNYDRVEKEDGS